VKRQTTISDASASTKDGRDNDGDGKADFDQDRGCSSAVDRTEQR